MRDAGGTWRLAATLARGGRLADVLPDVHAQAMAATGGSSSVLLRLDRRTGDLLPHSAAGLDRLCFAPWFDDAGGRIAVSEVWTTSEPRVVEGLPELADRLAAPVAVVAPLGPPDQRIGLLVVAAADRAAAAAGRDEVGAIADVLTLALEGARLQREVSLQRDATALSVHLAGSVSSSLHLGAALEILCVRAARLFGADRASIWLHDRTARHLELAASSDGADRGAERRVSTTDPQGPIALAMRRTEAVVVDRGDESPDIHVPLRGRRRALGTFELRGVRADPGEGDDLLVRLSEVARQISASIENVWLLDDVLRSRRELESTFNSLTDLVVVSDAGLRLTQANRAFATRIGRPLPDLLSRPLPDFFGRQVVHWIERSGRAGAIAPGDESREIADERLNGTFLFTLSPLQGQGGERVGTVIVARDVTAQARLEAERAELRTRLTQSEKLAALGQFVAGIAHELNNPLQGVLGHIELMLHEGGTASRFRRELRVVFREADRAAKIVHNLLVFAGSRRITRRRLNVNNVVERVLALRAAACAAGSIAVAKELAPNLPRVAGDALLLQQAVLNIVLNAEQAMSTTPAGARRLDVRTRVVRRHRIEIEIGDSGPGIPAAALPHLFEPFFTTKEVGQGTGLGLAIAYGVVQEHGGQLQAVNRAHGGAVFTIALPAGSADAVE